METFIKVIFWAIVIYYALKLIGRFLFPWILKRLVKKMTNNFQNFQNTAQENHNNKNAGDITIEYNNTRKKNKSNDEGEYVDFEEIKE